MKFTYVLAVVVLIIALMLPMLFVHAPALEKPEEPAPLAFGEADKELRFTALAEGKAREVTMDEWLPGVLAGEMPAGFEDEALKAQAVAARTYIMSRERTRSPNHPDADVCGDPSCCKAHLSEDELREKWGDNFDAYWRKMCEAVAATDGEYLSYEGLAIQAVFHSSSAGMTEASGAIWSSLPYLVSVSSPETAEDVPNYVSTVEVSVTDFADTLNDAGLTPDLSGTPDTWIAEIIPDGSGRVGTSVIGGVEIEGAVMRELFALRSTAFELQYTNGVFLFTVTGFGHGVGMSQYGANVMAQDGSDYLEILSHYYPGTTLSR